MASRLEEILKDREKKIENLRLMGFDLYPARSVKEAENREVVENFEKYDGKILTLAGRIMAWREHGKLTFAQLDIGDIIQATGKVVKTRTGEVSLEVTEIKILAKARLPLPEKWVGITDPDEAFRKRYLDLLMNPEKMRRFERKAKFWEVTRKFLNDKGFMEVETPVLESVTGGADAKPFVTHMNAIDQDFYLRISTELYQKRLIGAGFEKIYTIGPNFRNEGMDDEHLPEYYQCEWYWAYADYKDNMELVKELYRYVAKEVYGKTKFVSRGMEYDLADEWKEIDYVEIIKEKLGIDIFKSTDEEMLKIIKSKGVV
ncbi:MAG: Lysine-tRNA ligase, partial [Candidatus Collierbacteria bacterium GW2011_GWB1_44_6]